MMQATAAVWRVELLLLLMRPRASVIERRYITNGQNLRFSSPKVPGSSSRLSCICDVSMLVIVYACLLVCAHITCIYLR